MRTIFFIILGFSYISISFANSISDSINNKTNVVSQDNYINEEKYVFDTLNNTETLYRENNELKEQLNNVMNEKEVTEQQLAKERNEKETAEQQLAKERNEKEATEQQLAKERNEKEATELQLVIEKMKNEITEQQLAKERDEKEATEQQLVIEKNKKEKVEQQLIRTQEIVNYIILGLLILIISVVAFICIRFRGKKVDNIKTSNENINKKSGQTLNKNNIILEDNKKVVTNEIKDNNPKEETISHDTIKPTEDSTTIVNSSIGKSYAFAEYNDNWLIIGASVQGNGHMVSGLPCQDNHLYSYLGNGWGIAITSDGAGSASNSHIGSKVTIDRLMAHMKDYIQNNKWIELTKLPSQLEWSQIAFKILEKTHNDVISFANYKKIESKTLNATVIMIIHTPYGLLVTHIGDGRAGYKDMHGQWKAAITPHKGDEANQTVFLLSDFWNFPSYKTSGILVPESLVIEEKVEAFVLMSDGCENTSWLYNQRNEETGKFYDPNIPYDKFLNPLQSQLRDFLLKENINKMELAEKWKSFIESGNNSFKKETDDKTMLMGVLCNNNN